MLHFNAFAHILQYAKKMSQAAKEKTAEVTSSNHFAFQRGFHWETE